MGARQNVAQRPVAVSRSSAAAAMDRLQRMAVSP
jgi:hypothetical protein